MIVHNQYCSVRSRVIAANSGKPLGGRGSALNPTGEAQSASPDPLAGGERESCCPSSKNPTPALGLRNPRRLERQSCSGCRQTMGQPLHEVTRKYHFTFSFDSALSRCDFFHRELHSVTPAAFRHNFWSAGNNPNPKSDHNLDPWPCELKINRIRQTLEDTVPSFKSFRSWVFVLSC